MLVGRAGPPMSITLSDGNNRTRYQNLTSLPHSQALQLLFHFISFLGYWGLNPGPCTCYTAVPSLKRQPRLYRELRCYARLHLLWGPWTKSFVETQITQSCFHFLCGNTPSNSLWLSCRGGDFHPDCQWVGFTLFFPLRIPCWHLQISISSFGIRSFVFNIYLVPFTVLLVSANSVRSPWVVTILFYSFFFLVYCTVEIMNEKLRGGQSNLDSWSVQCCLCWGPRGFPHQSIVKNTLSFLTHHSERAHTRTHIQTQREVGNIYSL